MTPPEWDFIVIGAGPAGSVTARELARRGCHVLLVDKAVFPRGKVCGCCINGAAIEALEKVGLGHALRDAVPLEAVRIGAGSRSARVALSRGVALSREALDDRLVRDAVAHGVSFRPGTVARLGQAFEDHREVMLNSVPVSARVVILAGGLASTDSQPAPRSRIGAGAMLPGNATDSFYTPGTIFMATGRHGYVGLVRVEADRLDMAAAFDACLVKGSGGLAPAAVTILEEVGWPVPTGLDEVPWKGTPALTRRPVSVAARGLFLVGDAAGYVEPFTGEGMGWALMSALALAPIAATAVEGWKDGLARQWEAAHREVLRSRQRFCRVAARALRSPVLSRVVVHTLAAFPFLARPVVTGLNRPGRYPPVASP